MPFVLYLLALTYRFLLVLVRETGLEPVCLSAADFKSAVYTIPPLSHLLAYLQGLEPRRTVLETVMLPLH